MEVDRLRPSKEELCCILEDLIRIPSYPGLHRQETAAAEYIRDFFISRGIEAEIVPVLEGRCNVLARLRGSGGGRSLMLNGHLDTVPPYDMAEALIPRREGSLLFGRGSADMKGALACMMLALGRLKELDIRLAGDVIFAGVIDEEMTSEGTCALLNQRVSADAVVVGEPTDGQIALGHKGLQWFEFRIRGRAVHGGAQEKGINAIRQAARLIQRLERDLVPVLAARAHPVVGVSTLNYGFIQGGFQPSTVAGECVLQIDRRWIPGEDYRDVVNELEALVEELGAEEPDFSCELSVMEESLMPGDFIHQGFETDAGHPLVEAALQAAEAVTGVRPELTSFKAWTDAGLLGPYGGMPALVFGPGKLEVAHTSREAIDINQAVDFSAIYAALCIRFCGREDK